eukprot:CCRYP_002773-RE/>CCRYP_002773-RE protein AED:0.46 eAED:1.00 QI:0/0/0/1/0/0/2/0/170
MLLLVLHSLTGGNHSHCGSRGYDCGSRIFIPALHLRQRCQHGFSSIGSRLEPRPRQNLFLYLLIGEQPHHPIGIPGIDQTLKPLGIAPIFALRDKLSKGLQRSNVCEDGGAVLLIVALGGDGGDYEVQVLFVEDGVPIERIEGIAVGEQFGIVEFGKRVGSGGDSVREEG